MTLQPGQRELLAQAPDGAVSYRDPLVHCPACDDQAPDALCRQCAVTLARATAYLGLGRNLGPEVPA